MYCVCVLVKVVSHYDLSVLSMSVMGCLKKFDMEVGGVSSILNNYSNNCMQPV